MRKADEKTVWQVVEVGDSTDHNIQKKVQLIPEEILSGSVDSTAQASLPISFFVELAKKKKKKKMKTLNVILSCEVYIKTLNCVTLFLSFLLLTKYHNLI